MLQRQTIDIPVGFGLDENTGEPSVQAGKLMQAVDFRITKNGELQARTGFSAASRTVRDGTLGGTATISVGETAIAHRGDTLVADGKILYRYSSQLQQLCRVDDYPEFTLQSRKNVVRSGAHTTISNKTWPWFTAMTDDCCSVVFCDGFCVAIYCTDTGVMLSVFDATTMAKIGSHEIKGAVYAGRLFAHGNRVYWLQGQSLYSIQPRYVTTDWLGVSVSGLPEASLNGAACLSSDGKYLYVAGTTTVGTTTGTTGIVKVTAVYLQTMQTAGSITLDDMQYPKCICADATWIYVFAEDVSGDANPVMVRVSPAFTRQSLEFLPYNTYPVSAEAKPDLSGPIVCAMDLPPGNAATDGATPHAMCILDYLNGVFRTASHTYHVQPISGVRIVDGLVYVAVVSMLRRTNTDPTVVAAFEPPTAFLAQCPLQTSTNENDSPYQARPIVRFAKDSVFFSDGREYWLRAPALVDGPNGGLAVPVLVAGLKNGDYDATKTYLPSKREASGIDVFVFDKFDSSALAAIDVCGAPMLSGGVLAIANRDSVADVGFSWRPAISVRQDFHAVDPDHEYGLTFGKIYAFCACYCYVDDYGNVQRSEPSDPVTLEAGSMTGQFVGAIVGFVSHTLTSKSRWERSVYRPEFIEVYRTVGNGTEYHLAAIKDLQPFAAGSIVQDFMCDSDLATCRTLYTSGNVLENVAPPCAKAIARSPSRIAIASGDDPDTVWFSKQIVPGEIPGFHETLISTIPDSPITALSYIGDCLLVFTAQSIWAIFGQGPNDTGAGNDLTEPRLVSNAIGCIDPRSVVQYQGMTYFRAEQGIHRIGADLQIAFVGAPVRDQVAGGTITGAGALPDTQEIVWTLANSATAGTVLVYSVAFDQWLTWAPMDSTGARGLRFNGIANGCLLRSNGELLAPNGGQHEADSTHYVSPTMTTAWLHLAGIDGFQRVHGLSATLRDSNACSAEIALQYDYDGTPFWSRTWSATDIVAIAKGPTASIQVHAPKQKCSAIQATISFVPTDDSAPKLQGISLEVGVMAGQRRKNSLARGSK